MSRCASTWPRSRNESGASWAIPSDPLLVSVRSGAPVSMPGMMDTILNLGLNDRSVRGLANRSGDERFALDSYRRFDPDVRRCGDGGRWAPLRGRARPGQARARGGVGRRSGRGRAAPPARAVSRHLPGGHRRGLPPGSGRAARARRRRGLRVPGTRPVRSRYRRHEGIPDDLGTAVNVVQMVFGNKGPTSATGVAFTRNPSTGARELYGEFLVNAQGEDVVAGIRTPRPLRELEEVTPPAFAALRDAMQRLESHYRDMQDVEFTIEEGTLFILQTRSGKRTAQAAVRVAPRDGRRGRARPARGDRSDRPRPARPAAPPRHRPERRVRGARDRAQRLSGRRRRQGRVRRRHGRGPRPRRGAGDPRALRDDARRHPRDDPGPGRPDRARRHDIARGGRRAGDGQAVRRRRRVARDRSGRAQLHGWRHHHRGGRRDLRSTAAAGS